MAGRIARADIDLLRQNADIVEIVGQYTTLKKAGSRWKGLCPFHNEKTPSFGVRHGFGYKCFGCDVSGDVFDFVMAVEGLSFNEAVELVARRTGHQLTYEAMSTGQKRALGERSNLVALNEEACAFYRQQLMSEPGQDARDYLKARGFDREDAERFELGWAPNDWEQLSRKLQSGGAGQAELLKVGLSAQNNRGGLRDRFRGRLLFPIRSATGDLLGFGGRVVPGVDYGDFDPPKYLNTIETPLYVKTQVLYGLHLARAPMSREGTVLVCEGYTDVMALHQAGYENSVATCGTSVGPEHLRVLSRYADKVVLAFDGDEAGSKAAERAWEAAQAFDLDLRVLELPDRTDPADLVRQQGVEAVVEGVTNALAIVPFLIRRRLFEQDLATETGRVAALKAGIALLGQVKDADLRREYARTELATPLGVPFNFVADSARRAGVAIDRHDGVDVGVLINPRKTERGTVARITQDRAKIEREILTIALQATDLLDERWDRVEPEDFLHPTARMIHECMLLAGGTGAPLEAVLELAEDDEARAAIRSLGLEETGVEADADHARELIKRLLLPRARDRYNEARAQLEGGSLGAGGVDVVEVMRTVSKLQSELRDLQGADS